MRHLITVLGIALPFLVGCGITVPQVSPTPTVITTTAVISPSPVVSSGPLLNLTEEKIVIAAVGESFYTGRADCIQAIDSEITKQCVFPANIEIITKPEWEQLFPDTDFYLIDIGSWRSAEELLAHETQDGGLSRHIVAWQDEKTYIGEQFDRLLEDNAITITDANREIVAKSFALMSVPSYLGGDVQFLEWKAVEPGSYRHNYSHSLNAWTEIFGCEVFWWFVFTDQQMPIVSLKGGSCEQGDYIWDTKYFRLDCEAVPLGVPPYSKDYYFHR